MRAARGDADRVSGQRRFERKDTEQYHVCLGRPRDLAPRRPPVRAARARHDLRRHVVVAAVPGGPRAARPRVRGVLVHERLPGHRPGRPVPRHPAGQPGRGAGVVGAELARLREEPATAEELDRAKENLKGRVVLGARVDRRADEPARLRAARRAGRCCRSTRSSARIDAVTLEDLGALVDELWAPERLSAAGIGPDEDALRRGARRRRPARGRRRQVGDQGRGRRGRGADGRDGLPRGGGRRGHGAGRARRPGARHARSPTRSSAQPDVLVDFTVPDVRARERARGGRRRRPRRDRDDRVRPVASSRG